MFAPSLHSFVSTDDLAALIDRAKREDLGPANLDITSACFVPPQQMCIAHMQARKPGVLAGVCLLKQIAVAYDERISVTVHSNDNFAVAAGQRIATFRGLLTSVLAMERIALNFVTHLSGIATLTAAYVEAVRGTKAGIYDTRKTLPGLRGLQKYAVVCGGGRNHRIGLYDAVLVKDNHIAHVPLEELPAALNAAAARANGANPRPKFFEVEVDTLEQLERVLTCDIDIVLLDNMTPSQMRQAVAMRDRMAPGIELEASGGVNLASVRAIAETGVDRIAIGALTHSAPVLDVGLDIE